jgi:uncharacterized protein YndB with AHSA1/START domain
MLQTVIGAEFREVADRERDGKPAKAVVAARTYDTSVEDLWDALTNAERIPRWFAPVTGELSLGGRYQVQGNAGGTILRCEPPRLFDLTWEFAGAVSWVTVTLEPDGGGARLTLEHAMKAEDLDGEHWRKFGPGAVGVGWDLSFLGLGLHIDSGAGQPPEAAAAWMASEDAKAFMRASAAAWADAHIAGGERADVARGMAERTAAFYTGG